MRQYAFPIFLGAFLLFQVQPIIARCILPWYGGTPAVWTTCMLFFQVLLLAGYAYAHGLMRLRLPRQAALQSLVLFGALAVLIVQIQKWGVPIIPDASYKPQSPEAPVWQILRLLSLAVGLPYFVLATTSPLLQAWLSRIMPGRSPYRLYMLSNVGSLLALLSYPFVIEPALALRAQAAVWGGLYGLYALGYFACALMAFRKARLISSAHMSETGHAGPETAEAPSDRSATENVTARHWLVWIGLPALASVMLLAVTNQLCQELAVIPFLWILPLSLYLLSFIICFDSPRWYDRRVYLPAMLLILPVLFWIMMRPLDTPMRAQIAIYALALFICCMFCHGELVARKPHPRHLTAFYLSLSLGGALGGIFVGLIAPLLFTRFYELHLAVFGCWALGLAGLWRWPVLPSALRRPLTAAFALLALMTPVIYHFRQERAPVIMSHRNFYGIFRVEDYNREDPENRLHSLVHGATIHGLQYVHPQRRREPISYYSPESGLGLAITRHPRRRAQPPQPLRIGVMGLGTGNVAVYGQPGDLCRFYEINPAIEECARNPRYFTYLSDTPAHVEVKLGDARLTLEREWREMGSQQFDLLVMDAFSSDSVPAHLLTKEAFEIYLKHLRQPDGVIAVNISNRFLDLRPVVKAMADYYGLGVFLIINKRGPATYSAHWMLLTKSLRLLHDPHLKAAATPLGAIRRLRLWTDDYYNLFQILK